MDLIGVMKWRMRYEQVAEINSGTLPGWSGV